jgi:hypothetical protein
LPEERKIADGEKYQNDAGSNASDDNNDNNANHNEEDAM